MSPNFQASTILLYWKHRLNLLRNKNSTNLQIKHPLKNSGDLIFLTIFPIKLSRNWVQSNTLPTFSFKSNINSCQISTTIDKINSIENKWLSPKNSIKATINIPINHKKRIISTIKLKSNDCTENNYNHFEWSTTWHNYIKYIISLKCQSIKIYKSLISAS